MSGEAERIVIVGGGPAAQAAAAAYREARRRRRRDDPHPPRPSRLMNGPPLTKELPARRDGAR